MSMRNKPFVLFSLITFSLLFSSSALAKHKDHSKRGGEYSILENVRLNAKKVEYVGPTQINLLGKEYPASKFEIASNITVQTSCNGTYSGTFEHVIANYELIVGRDESNEVHDTFLKEVYKFWSSNPTNGTVISQYNLTLKKSGEYLIFMAPSSHDVNQQYYAVWIDGKFIKASFKSFRDREGWGALQELWENVLRFYVGKTKIEPELMVNEFPEEFLRLYKEGKIKLKNSG
jgi:hypothetical protein